MNSYVNMSFNLDYFPYVVPFSISLYLLLISSILLVRYRKHEGVFPSNLFRAMEHYFSGDEFEFCYWSCMSYPGPIVLLFVRTFSFIYLFFISFLAREIIDPGPPLSFTSWNVHLLWIYFFGATVASIVGLYHDDCLQETDVNSLRSNQSNFWSQMILRWGYVLQFMFSVAGSSAFFVTFVAFTFLNHRFDFWNVSFHFVTSMSVLVELLLNRMIVRWEHLALNLSWSFSYLVFSWIIVLTGVLTHWPYYFLDTSTVWVFMWYTALLLLNSIFYFLFWGLSHAKHSLNAWIRNTFFNRFSLLKSDLGLDDDDNDEDIEITL